METPQLDAAGDLRHLLTLDGLGRERITTLLDAAQALRPHALGRVAAQPLAGRTVVNLFFENSTRTRSSFHLAARRLGADVLDFDVGSSSARKGESLIDTLRNLEAMGADLFVVRHSESAAVAALAAAAAPATSIVNAGDGRNAHPTQGLLDLLTIRQHKGSDFGALTVAIVGDIAHSRVARSDIHGLRALGVGTLRIAAPANLLPAERWPGVEICHDVDSALRDADVVIALRLQRERMEEGLVDSLDGYWRDWGLTPPRLRLARPDAIVMHPGPMNRGVEIDDAVADGAQSVILAQVANGVAVRMAILAQLANRTAP
ncbi:aspartate carbamoyltransferase catalytic subunit [Chiayiivirga flava]|uniref:Aspartate carbamoyltransferase n=1 Tax=Chiayiivirga flava TaxID=659595 RepID=A0A7W8D5T4_9GAMM|nr:aspartate carbamoyltransferase catalytic subunit [Chiayiivirga flava]MBB5207256.1 aspartate carbamoyltransferase catalytic subunit [Chiayiivirga flava]